MNFQGLKKVETWDFYLDLAFRRAKKRADLVRSSGIRGNRLHKSRFMEKIRVSNVHGSINKSLKKILESFPVMDQLPPFYFKLLKYTLDYPKVKKSLGAVSWLLQKENDLFNLTQRSIERVTPHTKVNEVRRAYYGRLASIMRQIKGELVYLEETRRVMKKYPTVKTSVFSVALAGFPNIGKTTLMFKLTGSKPEIKAYPFTTKGVNVSYLTKGKKKVQLLDTPGTLNRFEKMNDIERIAYLAIEEATDMIVYIYDLTEPYPLKDQEQLLKNLKEFKKPIILYLSKTDILDKKVVKEFSEKHKVVKTITALKKELFSAWFDKEPPVEEINEDD